MIYKTDEKLTIALGLERDSELYLNICLLLNKTDVFKKHDFLRLLIGNLFYNWKMKQPAKTMLSLHYNNYLSKEEWRYRTLSTYKKVKDTITQLQKHSLITIEKGIWFGNDHKENKLTTIIPSQHLLEIFKKYKDGERPPMSIIPKSKKDQYGYNHILEIDIPRRLLTRKRLIEQINNLSYHQKVKNEKGEELNCELRSIYNDVDTTEGRQFGLCGRFYSRGFSYQQLSKADRLKITINREKVAELDYHCLHVNMLYAMAGAVLEGDAYQFLPTELRFAAKQFLLICLNCTSKRQAVQAMNNFIESELKEEQRELIEKYDLDWNQVFENMCDEHDTISSYICNPSRKVAIGMILQNIDSLMIEELLKTSYYRLELILPLHDSIIVPIDSADFWYEKMIDVYQQYNHGFTIEVSRSDKD